MWASNAMSVILPDRKGEDVSIAVYKTPDYAQFGFGFHLGKSPRNISGRRPLARKQWYLPIISLDEY
jgi:hypothetical protein